MHNNWNFHILLVTLQNNTAIWENSLAASYRVTTQFNNPTSRFYSREMTYMSTQNLHANDLAALLIITKNWKQPKYPETAEWVEIVVYTYNEILPSNELATIHAYSWINVKSIRLSKRSLTQKTW